MQVFGEMELLSNLTHVITSLRDSMAFSRVTLSGLSSEVCFLISEIVQGVKLKKKKSIGTDFHNYMVRSRQNMAMVLNTYFNY